MVDLMKSSKTKSDSIKKYFIDFNTGMSIIRRLLKNEYISEFSDKDDKRVKRISLTEKGKNVLFSVIHKMTNIAEIIPGNLSKYDKVNLLELLNRIDIYHRNNIEDNMNQLIE